MEIVLQHYRSEQLFSVLLIHQGFSNFHRNVSLIPFHCFTSVSVILQSWLIATKDTMISAQKNTKYIIRLHHRISQMFQMDLAFLSTY